MLELMARGGMRVGEVLKLTPNDVEDRKIFIRDPKSGPMPSNNHQSPYLVPERKLSFSPPAIGGTSDSNFNPRNTQCIPAVNPAIAGSPSLI